MDGITQELFVLAEPWKQCLEMETTPGKDTVNVAEMTTKYIEYCA